MLKQVQKNRVRAVAVKNMMVFVSIIIFCVEYMTEQLLAKFFQQEILGFKMRIEGSPAHIRTVDNFPHGYLVEIFCRKQLRKCIENCFPCFSLASVHAVLLYSFYRLFSNE
jgi:hypothetical protein